jgi:serine/threonine protein kinase
MEGKGKDSHTDWDIVETNLLQHRGEEEGDDVEMLNDYRVLKTLGKGSFGLVKKCQREVNEPPYREFALKVLTLSFPSSPLIDGLRTDYEQGKIAKGQGNDQRRRRISDEN